MNMSKSRDIQAKMHLNDKKSQSVFLSFKCILARNCEGTEQLRSFIQKTPSPTHPSIKKGVKKINRIVEKSNNLLIF